MRNTSRFRLRAHTLKVDPPHHRSTPSLQGPLARMAKALCDLGPPSYSSLTTIPPGQWCLQQPLWGIPYIQLEARLTKPTHALHPHLLHLNTLGDLAQLKRQLRLSHPTPQNPRGPPHNPLVRPPPSTPPNPLLSWPPHGISIFICPNMLCAI